MGSILTKLFESDFITFLIVFVAIPYLYLSLASDVQRDCMDVTRFAMDEKNRIRGRLKEINNHLEDISYVFNLDWWIVAAVAILLICLLYTGAFLEQSKFFCEEPAQGMWAHCATPHPKPVAAMKVIFMVYTILIGLLLAFRIWWARVVIAKQIRELYVNLGDDSTKPVGQTLLGESGAGTMRGNHQE